MKKLFRGSVTFQCSKLIDAFFGTGLFAGEQIFDVTVSFSVANFGIAGILLFNKIGVVQFVVELFNFFKSVSQTFLTLGLQSRADAVVAIPIDVLLDTFRVDMLAVGKVKTAVIVLGVISAMLSGASVVSC